MHIYFARVFGVINNSTHSNRHIPNPEWSQVLLTASHLDFAPISQSTSARGQCETACCSSASRLSLSGGGRVTQVSRQSDSQVGAVSRRGQCNAIHEAWRRTGGASYQHWTEYYKLDYRGCVQLLGTYSSCAPWRVGHIIHATRNKQQAPRTCKKLHKHVQKSDMNSGGLYINKR